MFDVNMGPQSVSEISREGQSESIHEGSRPEVVHDLISDPKKGSDGGTAFTVHVFGENGFEAAGIPRAPTGWIEMQFTLRVAPDGTVSVIADSTKRFPSISIYSYQSNGAISNV